MTLLSRPAVALAALLTLFSLSSANAAELTTITWHGHAAFEVTTPKGKVIWIDPWLKNPKNPAAADGKDPLAAVTRGDFVLITHGHFDHMGDAAAIGKKTGAKLVSSFDLGKNLVKLYGYPKEQVGFDTQMNIGGEITVADGEVTIHMTPAVHSSGLGHPFAGEKDEDVVFGGNPVGFIIKIKNGPTIYHTGDTAYFSDMELIGEHQRPDLALINIGGHFGMEPPMAAKAAAAVRAKFVVAHHYGTYPILTQDPKEFANLVKRYGAQYVSLAPGGTLRFEGRALKK